MSELYRGHEIIMVPGAATSAVIVDRATGAELPTKVTALPDEAEDVCLGRARDLVDLYIETAARLAPYAS